MNRFTRGQEDDRPRTVRALLERPPSVKEKGWSEAVLAHAPAPDTDDPATRYRAAVGAFLGALAAFPDEAQTLLVEIIGAGPRAMERRDRALDAVAKYVDELNREDAERGAAPRLASPDDAFAIIGAAVELASRQIRTGRPADIRELEPVVERLALGLLAAGSPPP